MKLLILNGVNLNRTGMREKSVYGNETLEDINREIAAFCAARGAECEFFQSNLEGDLCTKIQETDAGFLDHPGQLSGGDGSVYIRIAGSVLVVTADLEFLRCTGHYRYTVNLCGIDSHLLREISL